MRCLAVLGALLLVSCKTDEPKPAPPSAPSALSTAPQAGETNPFVRTYPFTTATITYSKKDGTFTDLTRIKGQKVRRETTGGMWASDSWSLSDSDAQYNVIPKDRKIIVLRSEANHLFEVYLTLKAAQQEQVRKSDALFTLPADFTRETSSIEETMHGVYRNLVERMEKPDFALANEQRQIGISK